MESTSPQGDSREPNSLKLAAQVGSSITKDAPKNTPSEVRGNFFKVACFQIILRTGWIFKTESIVMPAVLDTIQGQGWVRGILPVLNRFGQSIPPLLAAEAVTRTPLKKRILSGAALMMGVSFLSLAWIWNMTEGKAPWLAIVFLMIYGLFFVSVGILNLSLSTLIGKVIKTDRRGRLMLLANIGGASCAVLCAWFLLRQWLSPDQGNFAGIFAFAGGAFVIAAMVALWLKEIPDQFESNGKRLSAVHVFGEAWKLLRYERHFRVLAILGGLFGLSLTLFPHYQAMGREDLKVGLDSLIPWLIAQNIGVACFSFPAGWIADRYGNRLVLRLLLSGLCIAPILALVLASMGTQARTLYICVFVLLGLTPVTFRVLSNYTLELVGRERQPQYLGTLSLSIAVPTMLLSPILGLSVDWLGFRPVFLLVWVCLIGAFFLTFRLHEPRLESPE